MASIVQRVMGLIDSLLPAHSGGVPQNLVRRRLREPGTRLEKCALAKPTRTWLFARKQ